MDTDDIIEYALIAVGAYFVYNYFFGSSSTASTPVGVAATATPVVSSITSGNPIRSTLLQMGTQMGLGNPPMGTVDQWNAAYANVKSLTTNPLESNPTDYGALVQATGGGQISVDQYLNALSSTGLGNLRQMPRRRSMSFGGNGIGEIVNNLTVHGSETLQ